MPTIIDVAREAGVSFKTVSRVLNGEKGVKSETRDKVYAAAQTLNYTVNAAARNLRAKAPKRLALLIDNPSQSYTEATQIGAMLACQPFGFQLAIFESYEQLADLDDLVGVVILPPLCNDPHIIEKLSAKDMPFVRIGAERSSDAGDRIGIDDRAATKEMTEYLIGLGHEDIAYISGSSVFDVSRRRYLGFEDAMRSAGLPIKENFLADGDYSYESGLRAAEALLSQNPKPSAIFSSNDEMACACLATAYKMNIRVPDMLSVVGFDDAPLSRVIYPRLTTVQQSVQDMVGQAVDILAKRLVHRSSAPKQIFLDHKILRRESTARPSTDRSEV